MAGLTVQSAGENRASATVRRSPTSTSGYFVLEALNSAGAVYYGYYIFFFLQQHFGFGNLGNLTFSAVNGFVYIFSAWIGGKFAQKHGYYTAIVLGSCTAIICLLLGSQWHTLIGQFLIMIVWTIGMCFTWPSLEALISENRGPGELPRMIGIYNVVWAGTGALTYFCGGALFERLGEKSLFLLPVGLHCIQLALLAFLWRRRSRTAAMAERAASAPSSIQEFPTMATVLPTEAARLFLRMAWLANPFAYIAINTVIAVIPQIAKELQLSPTFAGFFCSIWFFVRLGTFVLLWQWTAWHYRFKWLLGAFAGLVASFTLMLLVPKLSVLILSQCVFGLSVGLIYYSSLFYSMDVGETKGEHGGIHEAAIGVGIFMGPAVGATALRLLPQFSNSGAWAVSGLLSLGLVLLILMRARNRPRDT